MTCRYTLVLHYGTNKFYLAPRASIYVEEDRDMESLASAGECASCGGTPDRDWKLKLHFEGNCSSETAWAFYRRLQAFLDDACDSDLLIERSVCDETPLLYKVTRTQHRMTDIYNQYLRNRLLTIEVVLSLTAWAVTGSGVVLVGPSGGAVSNILAMLSPYIIDVSFPNPTVQLVNSLSPSPLVVTSTIPVPGPTLALPAQTPLVITSTIPVPGIAPSVVPLTVALTLKTPEFLGQYGVEVLGEAGLVGYWPLNEPSGTVATDLKNANNGTYTGGPTLGQAGPLASLSNSLSVKLVSTSYVTIPDSSPLDVGNLYTMEALVKRTSTGVIQIILSKQPSAFIFYFNTDNTLNVGVAGTVGVRTTTSTFTDTTKWHHLVATKNSGTIHIYVDGVDQALTGTVVSVTNNNAALLIGRHDDSGTLFATDNYMAEVALYNTELSGADVTSHYNAAVADGLVV
jgi:hypothetical protein